MADDDAFFEMFEDVLHHALDVIRTNVRGAEGCVIDPQRMSHIRASFAKGAPSAPAADAVARWFAWFLRQNRPISGADPHTTKADVNAAAATACALLALCPEGEETAAIEELVAGKWNAEMWAIDNARTEGDVHRAIEAIIERLDTPADQDGT